MLHLTDSDSPARVIDAVIRHERLCRQNRGAEKYVQTLAAPTKVFNEAMAAKEAADMEVTAAYDSVRLQDLILDDILRKVNGRAKEADKTDPAGHYTEILFPAGLTGIVNLALLKEPDAAHLVAQKIQSLGREHVLFPLANEIEEAITNCRTAAAGYTEAVRKAGDANTTLTLAKLALIRQYNANYHTAASEVSKGWAEKLFPQLNKGHRTIEAPEEPAPAA